MALREVIGGIGKTLKWGGIALAVIIGVLLAINALDEKPSPELEALLVTPRIKADPANGFLALVGSAAAPANEDFVEFGKQWVDAYNGATNKAAIEAARVRFPGSSIKFIGDEKQLCNPMKAPCLPQAKAHAAVWRKFSADNAMMLARQRRLTEFTRFQYSYFPPSFESPLPVYSSSASRQLLLDLIALDAAEGRVEPALAALEARIAFDRRVLLDSGGLLMAMVSASWLRQDYALLAEIVAIRPKSLATQKARLLRMTEPLEIEQVRLIAGNMLEDEFRFLSRNVAGLRESPNFLVETGGAANVVGRLFFQVHATQNLEAQHHAAIQASILNFTPEQSEAWIAQVQLNAQSGNDELMQSWRVLYNPVGKMFSGMMEVSYGAYVLKLSDLMGVMRLAHLQAGIVADGKAAADMSSRIATDPALYNPYTGKPMNLDADKRHLYFDTHGNVPSGVSKRVQVGI